MNTPAENMPVTSSSSTDKKILPAFLLCFFLGMFGAHRFYVGKIGTAILQIVTLGGLGIWVLIDFIMIIVGAFTDKQGHKLTEWT
jgi:TM2 domain-containing membrane protein YozV